MKIWSIFITFYAHLSCSMLVSQEITPYEDGSSRLLSESFLSLPEDIGTHTLSFLEPKELRKTSTVSKQFNQLSKDVVQQKFQAEIYKKKIGTHILSFLELKELRKTSTVSKQFNQLSKDVVQQKFQAEIQKKKPCFDAIRHILSKLEECIQEGRYSVKFYTSPKPNLFYKRTEKYLFLETGKWENREHAQVLWTPFGKVELLGGGTMSALDECSKTFWDIMKTDWVLKDVTDTVEDYSYVRGKNEEKLSGSYEFEKEPWKGAGTQTCLYLIQHINGYNFIKDSQITADKLIVYSNTKINNYEFEKAIFSALSDGKNRF